MVIAALPLPNASPPQPASTCLGYFSVPFFSMLLHELQRPQVLRAVRGHLRLPLSVIQPPACFMKAPMRS